MIVTLHRIKQDQYGTHGVIEDAEGNVICSTIERPWLNNAHGVSCVPDRDYPCEPHIKSNNGQHCWELQNVPDRTGILIHTGNTEGDSEGCIIVGLVATEQGVGQSQAALDLLHQKLPSTFTLKIVSTFNLQGGTT